jgi:hypothetical protein
MTSISSTGFNFSATYLGSGTVEIQFTVPTTSGNFAGGLRALRFWQGPGSFQCQFDPPIPKTSNDRVIFKFRFTFTRRT